MSAELSKETLQAGGVGRNTESDQKQRPAAEIALPFRIELIRQERAKGAHHHQAIVV